MRTQTLAWLMAVTVLATAAPAWALGSGETAPPFDIAGSPRNVRLSDYTGKVLYLDVWASWCVPCRQSFPWMNEMLARYQDKGFRILAVNVDRKPADAARFLQQVPAKFDLAFDAAGNVPRSYGVKAMPSSFLIGPDGRVLAVHSGFADEDKAVLEKAIRDALQIR